MDGTAAAAEEAVAAAYPPLTLLPLLRSTLTERLRGGAGGRDGAPPDETQDERAGVFLIQAEAAMTQPFGTRRARFGGSGRGGYCSPLPLALKIRSAARNLRSGRWRRPARWLFLAARSFCRFLCAAFAKMTILNPQLKQIPALTEER